MLLTIITFIIVLGLLIFVHELGHFIMARISNIKVEEFAFGFPPRIYSFQKGETRYSLNLIPVGGYVKLLGEDKESHDPRSFSRASAGKRFLILLMGIVGNLILAWLALVIAFSLGASPLVSEPEQYGGIKTDKKIFVAQVVPDSPAKSAGLDFGEEIISADGVTFDSVDQFQKFTKNNAGKTINLNLRKGKNIINKTITLRQNIGNGSLGVVVVEDFNVKYLPWKIPFIAAGETGKTLAAILKIVGNIIKDIFTGKKITAEIAGPVGIYNLTGRAVQLGMIYLAQFVALISLNLAIFNILPFPALDGGRILFIAIEKIRGGKKISPAIENALHGLGFFLIILLLIFITYRDIVRIFQS